MRANMAKPKTRKTSKKPSSPAADIAFNHAMIYVRDVPTAVSFYEQLGMRLIEQFGDGYARLRSPKGNTTIALHQIGEDIATTAAEGIRLYFEIPELERACRKLAARGMQFKQMPQRMPWGWTHAYLDDPDGHEISLYLAGRQRLRRARLR
jgi:catechol 2,3-dioxygenase-like lactoylglutathione lyase family enzyme